MKNLPQSYENHVKQYESVENFRSDCVIGKFLWVCETPWRILFKNVLKIVKNLQ